MEKDKKTAPDIDVTDERYKGPPMAIVVAGHGSIEHLLFAFIGLLGAGTVAYFAPESAKLLVDRARVLGKEYKDLPVAAGKWSTKIPMQIKRSFGSLLRGVFGDNEIANELRADANRLREQAGALNAEEPASVDWFDSVATDKERGFGNAFLSHTVGMLPVIGKPFRGLLKESNERWANAVSVGGLAGVVGYATGWSKALLLGSVHGNKGRHQFERAKEQIKNLQEDNADLNKINDDLHARYVRAATRADSLEDAQGNAAPSNKPFASEVHLGQSEHHGKLAQQHHAAEVA